MPRSVSTLQALIATLLLSACFFLFLAFHWPQVEARRRVSQASAETAAATTAATHVAVVVVESSLSHRYLTQDSAAPNASGGAGRVSGPTNESGRPFQHSASDSSKSGEDVGERGGRRREEGAISRGALSKEVVESVENFLFFVGHSASSCSAIASLLNAHPHIVLADHRLYNSSVLEELDSSASSLYSWKRTLFDLLYEKSREDASNRVVGAPAKGSWRGEFSGFISVIGDTSCEVARRAYFADEGSFLRSYMKLKYRVSFPRVLHVLSNPFDVIASAVTAPGVSRSSSSSSRRRREGGSLGARLRMNSSATQPEVAGRERRKWAARESGAVDDEIHRFFAEFEALMQLFEGVFKRRNVLHVHGADFAGRPGREPLLGVLEFLGVESSDAESHRSLEAMLAERGLEHAPRAPRSRDTIRWTAGQIGEVEGRLKKYDVLSRYNFSSA